MSSTGSCEPLRIAVGIHSLQLGGSQINTIDLASGLRARGHDVRLFAIDQPPIVSVEPVAERAGFEITKIPAESSLVRQARRITEIVDRWDPQIVHVYHEDHWLGPLGSIALLRRPEVALVVTNWMMENNAWLPLHAPLIVGFERLREEAASRLQRGPVYLLEPPVDVDHDAPDPARGAAFRLEHGIGPDETAVVLVTRVDRRMKLDGIRRTIAATQRIDRPDVRTVIVGDGDAMDEVRELVAAANAELGRDAIVLTGALHDPRPAYDAADVVLGMGGSALRGLAFGRAVVVVAEHGFSLPVTPETIDYFFRNGYHGYAEIDEQGIELAAQITDLLDPGRRAELGGFGAQVVRERYALDVLTERLEGYYRDALATRPNLAQRSVDVAYVLGYDLVHRGVPPGVKQAIRRRIPRLRTGDGATDDTSGT